MDGAISRRMIALAVACGEWAPAARKRATHDGWSCDVSLCKAFLHIAGELEQECRIGLQERSFSRLWRG